MLPYTKAMDTTSACAGSTGALQPTFTSLAKLLKADSNLVSATQLTTDLPITGAACDSRCVRAGNIFFCKGRAFKPTYLTGSLEAGAVAYICDEEHATELSAAAPEAPAIVSSDMRRAMALVSAAAWGYPDRALPQVGLTGTKGKSTTAYLLHGIIQEAHKTCGIIGSIETDDGVEHFDSINTTPEAPDLWRHLANARDAKLDAMVMEISSQALKYDRSLGVHLDIAAFLNIGRDHISPLEHPNFEDYFASKLKIFKQCDTAVVNLATTHLDRVLNAARQTNLEGKVPQLITVSSAGPEPVECGSCDMVFPDIWATNVEARGAQLSFVAHGSEGVGARAGLGTDKGAGQAVKEWELPITLGFPGLFNVDNALVAIACAKLLGIADEAIAAGLAKVQVPGRMQSIATASDNLVAVVDYAHNATSMEALLSSLRKSYPAPDWQLNVVFGSTGSKGLERRSDMGRIAGKYADRIILTEDDPGNEDPADICAEIASHVEAQGNTNYQIILDRQQAIEGLVQGAAERAVIAAVGKGPDCYMERAGRIDPYEGDAAILERALKTYRN